MTRNNEKNRGDRPSVRQKLSAASYKTDADLLGGTGAVKRRLELAANLTAQIADLDRQKRLAGTSPGMSNAARWTDQVKKIEPGIFH